MHLTSKHSTPSPLSEFDFQSAMVAYRLCLKINNFEQIESPLYVKMWRWTANKSSLERVTSRLYK
ncbi:hypothetical protein HYFRA_00008906 [Hymenoscyphus fraxineus]|uniref:Uncharacterized protein n=1 Tax=Hymenoscyphus fraxineus TaxID=746836 RepID=A0A9N9KX91_9HELO|nr:hypothetical protein HYFRA_00008906 [Hymenoscyphus fraxineus]